MPHKNSYLFATTRLGYLEIPIYMKKGLSACGETNSLPAGQFEITLREGMNADVMWDTLIHEALHVIDLQMELNLECEEDAPPYQGSHRVIQQLGSGLAQMLLELRFYDDSSSDGVAEGKDGSPKELLAAKQRFGQHKRRGR